MIKNYSSSNKTTRDILLESEGIKRWYFFISNTSLLFIKKNYRFPKELAGDY
jgi:hypothetical protein